jgi:pyruvate dehydrogenase E2 component (dihydrolipoamide acetyltransferase)
MTIDICLSQLADSMISAKVAAWLKKEGDFVAEGEPIVEVETDKASVEITAPASGILDRINVPAGTENVNVGAVLARIRQGAEPSAPPPPEPPPPAVRSAEPTLRDRPIAREELDPAPSVAAPAIDPHERIVATPLARRIAAIAQIAIEDIAPERGQRVRKADVEREITRRRGPQTPQTLPTVGTATPTPFEPSIGLGSGPFQDKPLSAIRRVTARRMQQAKQTIPHFYLQSDCRADELLELRARLNARNGQKLTLTDFTVRAAALALRRVPDAGAAWIETGVRVFEHADIAVAVATPEGLITPVVRDAGRKGIEAISREIKLLSERARAGRLQPAEYSGGTLTISNLGMYGVTSIYPIINPPQSCILGIGAVEQRPIVSNGQLAVGHMFSITLAADHRALDGAVGAEFLREFRTFIEDPLSMVMES